MAKESRFVRQKMNFFSFSFRSLPIIKLNLNFSFSGVRYCPLPIIKRLPFEIKMVVYAVVQLLFFFVLAYIVRSGFLLVLDELSRAVAQFYPSLGGMNGGLNPPPAPGNSTILAAAASHEAGPSVSDPNSHLFEEERQHLDRLREDNRRRLQENANLLKRAQAEFG